MKFSMRSIAGQAWSWSPTALATVLVVLICLKAIMAVDMVWDSLSYQLPFSALRVGLLTDWQFQRPPPEQDTLKGYYLGFPILADLLRGWMWKFSGRPEAVNLLSIISVLALVAYLKWTFRQLEVAWVLLGILAIPAVQTAAASNYVDLPSNAAFTIFLFSIVDLWSNPEKFRRPALWIVILHAVLAAANTKTSDQRGRLHCDAIRAAAGVAPAARSRGRVADNSRLGAAGTLRLDADCDQSDQEPHPLPKSALPDRCENCRPPLPRHRA